MGDDFFYLGDDMRLFSNTGFKLLVLFLFFPFYSYSALWNDNGYWFLSLNFKDDLNNFSNSSCRLSSSSNSSVDKDGNPNEKRDFLRISFGKSSLVFQYGTKIHEKPQWGIDSVWNYAERYSFSNSLSDNQSSILSNALKTALKNDNCETAQLLFDSLLNPFLNEDGTLSFSDGESSCAITSSGHQSCDISAPPLSCDENGENCHIIIGIKEGTVDDFAKAKPKDKTDSNNQDVPGGSNLDQGLDGSGGSSSGSGGSSSGSGGSSSGGSGDSSGSGSGGSSSGGSGSGSGGSGVGSGDGEGDGEGDGKGDGKGELPTLEEFNISNSLSKLKSKLKDKLNTQSCSVSGECPTITVELFGSTHSIDIHCKIISENGEGIRTGFNFLWTTIAVLIILSA